MLQVNLCSTANLCRTIQASAMNQARQRPVSSVKKSLENLF